MADTSGGWKSDAIAAAQHWLTLIANSSGQQPRWKAIGRATPARDEPGWSTIDRRNDPIKPDALSDVCFSAKNGPEASTAYPIETFRQQDGLLWLKEPPALPKDYRTVWIKTASPRMLVEKLVNGLTESGRTPVADAFATGRLGATPARGITVPPGLVGNQPDAYRACRSPGVRMVWGPPGAGKTRVLASAIEDLVLAGKRVLLVSTANVAVDNALAAVVTRMRPKRGVVLRVGPPQLADIANNPDIQLHRLAADASAEVDEQREAVEVELAELTELDDRVAELSARVGDYTPAAFRVATDRIANERRLTELSARQPALEEAAADARAHMITQSKIAETAQHAVAQVAAARAALLAMDRLVSQRNALDLEWHQKGTRLRAAEARLHRTFGWFAKRKVKRERDDAARDLAAFEQFRGPRWAELTDLIKTQRATVGSVTRERIAALDTALHHADQRARDAAGAVTAAEQRLAEFCAEMNAIRAAGVASTADHDFIQRTLTDDLATAYLRLEALTAQQRNADSRRATLNRKHKELVDRARSLRQDAEQVLVDEAKMVATTLARSRLHHALAKSSFDVVLVDEAGAASLVEVMLALCRATTTAVLFGDFLQLSPVQEKTIRNSEHPQMRSWVVPDPFTHVQIRTPKEAIEHPGCVPLLHQFRFGPTLRRLANDVIYDVLRDAADLPGVTHRQETEIVFLDTSDLGELAQIRFPGGKRGWWPAGVVLARALTEHHLAEEGEVGVVTPYGIARDAILAGLRDRNLVTGVAVGTVHAFQGREFPTVVFDLVEDGRGWIAKAKLGGGSYEEDGVRLFGVGITRARHRLYLIGDSNVVKQASGPLAQVRAAGRANRLHVWSATELLGMAPARPTVDAAFVEVSETLRQLVTVSDITDEKTFYDELKRELALARQRVWMWSPWISTRANQVVPLVEAAVRRGVDVCVFLRPDTDRNMARDWAQRQLPGLVASGATVIRSEHEHRKIVVIDDMTVLFGSLNALSNSPAANTRESMLTLRGKEFAHRMLEELHAADIGTPHPCSRCGETCEVRRAGGKRTGLSWYCSGCRRAQSVPIKA